MHLWSPIKLESRSNISHVTELCHSFIRCTTNSSASQNQSIQTSSSKKILKRIFFKKSSWRRFFSWPHFRLLGWMSKVNVKKHTNLSTSNQHVTFQKSNKRKKKTHYNKIKHKHNQYILFCFQCKEISFPFSSNRSVS